MTLAHRVRPWLPKGTARLVRRVLQLVDPHAQLSYSYDGEDRILTRIFQDRAAGFYVDVGAHHPFRFSNTCALHQKGWRGINIDADPALMEAFAIHRPDDINLSAGVSEMDGILVLHIFDEPALNTFDEAIAASRVNGGTYRLAGRTQVPVHRLDAILAAHCPPGQTIDLLTIDVEGFDLKVLQSNDWERYRPTCVVVEALLSSFASIQADPCHLLLTGHGYRFHSKTSNSLIYLTDRD
jgi:FkbM family methyltransferase